MAVLNPMQLLGLLKQGNPQAVVQSIIQKNYGNDPMMQNLLKLGEKGDVQSLKQFAQEYFSRQGKDFNKEMDNLISTIKELQAN